MSDNLKLLVSLLRMIAWLLYYAWLAAVGFVWLTSMNAARNSINETTITCVAMFLVIVGYTAVRGLDQATRWEG